MIICRYSVTCSVSGQTHRNDGWFRDQAHFERVLNQWNAYRGPWKQNYMTGVAHGKQCAFSKTIRVAGKQSSRQSPNKGAS